MPHPPKTQQINRGLLDATSEAESSSGDVSRERTRRIPEADRLCRWPLDRRPDHHHGLSDLGV